MLILFDETVLMRNYPDFKDILLGIVLAFSVICKIDVISSAMYIKLNETNETESISEIIVLGRLGCDQFEYL